MQNDVAVWECNGVPFQVGDRVKVIRFEQDFAPNGMGKGVMWDNTWVEDEYESIVSMNSAIGKEYEIAEINEHGAFFTQIEECVQHYGFPLTALENLSYKEKLQ